jgi:hypothetical protein
MCFEAQSHETSLKRLRPQIGSGLPLFTSCLEEVFSETQDACGGRQTEGRSCLEPWPSVVATRL